MIYITNDRYADVIVNNLCMDTFMKFTELGKYLNIYSSNGIDGSEKQFTKISSHVLETYLLKNEVGFSMGSNDRDFTSMYIEGVRIYIKEVE